MSDHRTPQNNVPHLPTIFLSPDKKQTEVFIYAGSNQETIAEAFIRQLGDPSDLDMTDGGTLIMIFPHQNLNPDLMKVAQQNTDEVILTVLGAPDLVPEIDP